MKEGTTSEEKNGTEWTKTTTADQGRAAVMTTRTARHTAWADVRRAVLLQKAGQRPKNVSPGSFLLFFRQPGHCQGATEGHERSVEHERSTRENAHGRSIIPFSQAFENLLLGRPTRRALRCS